MNIIFRLQVLLFMLAALTLVHAQPNGTVEGRIVNGTDPSIIARSVELDVVELGAGMRILKTALTDAFGRFRVEGLPQNGRLMLRVNYKDVNYHRQFNLPAQGKASVDIEVYEPTDSMKGIKAEDLRMAFQATGDRLVFLEAVTFHNETNPPRTLMRPEGNFHFSKLRGILVPPEIRVTPPGSMMPVILSALESPDGRSYYSLYPIKPGITAFEAQQVLPYKDRNYLFKKVFYHDAASVDIGVIPADMVLSGSGLEHVATDRQQNFSVYRMGPVKSGTEITWILSGGSVPTQKQVDESETEPSVVAVPDFIHRNALIIGPLLLMGFVLALWYSFNRGENPSLKGSGRKSREFKEQKEQLLRAAAELDHRFETRGIEQKLYQRRREAIKRQLTRFYLFSKN